jgi:hypothetical protein
MEKTAVSPAPATSAMRRIFTSALTSMYCDTSVAIMTTSSLGTALAKSRDL